MKKPISITIVLIVTVILIFGVSCDKINPPYMKANDVTDCPVPEFPANTDTVKTLLLEDFTGHLCINCPEAAHYVHQIKDSLGKKVIILSIHSGGTADPESGNYSLDLRTPGIGDEIYSHFSIPANPRAMFNRELIGGVRTFDGPSGWFAMVKPLVNKPQEMSINIINNFDPATGKICIHVRSRFFTASTGTKKLVVMIKEDSIHGYQKNNNPAYGPVFDIPDYTFMDVLRTSLNGPFGETIVSGNVPQDTVIIKTYKQIADPAWKPRHLKVVAYVYDSDTEVILQAAEQKVQ